MFLYRAQTLWLLTFSAVLVLAVDVAWKDKKVEEWSEEDARQVLTDSPWAKTAIAMVSGLLTEDQRREGGKMGQDHGVGFDGLDQERPWSETFDAYLHGIPDPRRQPHPIQLKIIWHSARPIGAAEIKVRAVEPFKLEGDGYRIAVYGIPGGPYKKDPTRLGNPLKKNAALKRAGKKDVRPSSVGVFQGEHGLVIVYLFPMSGEITRKDGHIQFDARIGRIAAAQSFNLAEMEYKGKLEL